MNYPNEEKETTCVFDYLDNKWEVYSCVPKHIRKLSKIAEPYWTEKDGDRVTAAKWKLNSNQVRFAAGTARIQTEEQLEASRVRMRALSARRNEIEVK